MKKNLFSWLLPLLIAAGIIAILIVITWDALRAKHIEPVVVMIANGILLLTSCLNIYFQQENLKKSNPQAVMRGIIGATMFKLFFLVAIEVNIEFLELVISLAIILDALPKPTIPQLIFFIKNMPNLK